MSTTPLPPHLARWAEAVLGKELPGESRATCDHCAMCANGDAGPLEPEASYSPGVKCCTYMPHLPGFNVGMILADRTPEMAPGRALVLDRVQRRIAITPLGMGPGPEFRQRYMQASEAGTFGTRADLLCPYYVDRAGGLCSIWRYRETICATFFCKFDEGVRGGEFWVAMKDVLKNAQAALTAHCLRVLELDLRAMDELRGPDGKLRRLAEGALRGWVTPDGEMPAELARRLWGKWYGREEEFYLACGEIVTGMTWAEIRALAGVQLDLAEDRARDRARARADRSIPARLYVGSVAGSPIATGQISVCSSEMRRDPARLEPALWEALAGLAGGDTATLRAALAERGQVLDDAAVRRLVDHAILVAPDGRDQEPSAADPPALTPDDRLSFFRWFQDCPVIKSRELNEAGQPQITISCGAKEVSFDEPDLFDFAEQLVQHQHGFRAADTMRWGGGESGHPWERVRELLDALLADQVLQRLPEPAWAP